MLLRIPIPVKIVAIVKLGTLLKWSSVEAKAPLSSGQITFTFSSRVLKVSNYRLNL